MKKSIFSKFAGWQSATFSHNPWAFYQIKKCVKKFFLPVSFLGKNFGNEIVKLY